MYATRQKNVCRLELQLQKPVLCVALVYTLCLVVIACTQLAKNCLSARVALLQKPVLCVAIVSILYVSSRQPSLSNCSRILRAMIMNRKRPAAALYQLLTRLLGLDYTVYTLLPIITMDQFSLKPTTHQPVLYSYNICAVPRRLELENGINRRPNQNQASVSSTTTTTVYHLYQFSPIFWHYFIGLK